MDYQYNSMLISLWFLYHDAWILQVLAQLSELLSSDFTSFLKAHEIARTAVKNPSDIDKSHEILQGAASQL